MVKAVLIHILFATIYIIIALYVIGDEQLNMSDRFLIVFFFCLFQFIPLIICGLNDLYDENKNKIE